MFLESITLVGLDWKLTEYRASAFAFTDFFCSIEKKRKRDDYESDSGSDWDGGAAEPPVPGAALAGPQSPDARIDDEHEAKVGP